MGDYDYDYYYYYDYYSNKYFSWNSDLHYRDAWVMRTSFDNFVIYMFSVGESITFIDKSRQFRR